MDRFDPCLGAPGGVPRQDDHLDEYTNTAAGTLVAAGDEAQVGVAGAREDLQLRQEAIPPATRIAVETLLAGV